jgi:hypothetical protein
MAVGAAGCGGSDEDATPPTTTAPSTAAATTTAPISTVAANFQDGDLIVADDFSDSTPDWGSEVVATGEYGYAEGAYRILVETADNQLSRHLGGERVEGVRVEVHATLVAGTSGDAIGVLCYTDLGSDEGYMLVIQPADLAHAIYAFRGEAYQLLDGDGGAEIIRPVGEGNQLEVNCGHIPGGPNGLIVAVNGQQIGQVFDEELTGGFNAFGMVVDSPEGGADGHFDDLVVTELVPG